MKDIAVGEVFAPSEARGGGPKADDESSEEGVRGVRIPHPARPSPHASLLTPDSPLVPALTVQAALEKLGHGWLVGLQDTEHGRVYGRGFKVADVLTGDRVVLVKWVRRLTNWHGRLATLAQWETQIRPAVERSLGAQRTPVVRWVRQRDSIVVHVSLADLTLKVPVDRHGIALWRPPEREVAQPDCEGCEFQPLCRQLSPAAGTAALWRRLQLVDGGGVPTRRGRIVAALSQTAGLAVAAAIEDQGYPLDELVYDLANLDAGFRFAGEDSRWGGRLAIACQRAYGLLNVPGYLENGLPPRYGAGASEIVQLAHRHPEKRHRPTRNLLGEGDVDRLIIEWRSLLRQIAHAPALDAARWTAFQALAKEILNQTDSPTLTDLPPLPYHQTKRLDHRLSFRRGVVSK